MQNKLLNAKYFASIGIFKNEILEKGMATKFCTKIEKN